MFSRDLKGATRNGKPFRRNLDLGVEYSPLLGTFESDEESNSLKTPQGAPHMVNQGITRIPCPSAPPLPSSPPHTPTPKPPPPLFNMMISLKMPIFKGLGT